MATGGDVASLRFPDEEAPAHKRLREVSDSNGQLLVTLQELGVALNLLGHGREQVEAMRTYLRQNPKGEPTLYTTLPFRNLNELIRTVDTELMRISREGDDWWQTR